MQALKVIGLLFVFASSSLLGVFCAFRVKKREKCIEGLSASLRLLADDIKIGSGSKEKLIFNRFGGKTVFFADGKLHLDRTYLKSEEAEVLENFLNAFGRKDRLFEYERATDTANRLDEIFKKVLAESNKICKLYCSTGMLFGIMLCILFI